MDIGERAYSERCATCSRYPQESDLWINLSKKGFRIIFELVKFVLTKGGMYVGKGYLVDELFKANDAVVDKKSVYLYLKRINKEKSSVYLLESPILWHARLGHVNYTSLKTNLGYIPVWTHILHKYYYIPTYIL